MATTIKLKNGSGAPLAGDLVQGEPALDLTNKRLYTEDSGGTVIEVGTNPSTLTVDTTTLVVDAGNNRVGVGTASPSHNLDVTSSTASTDVSMRVGPTASSGDNDGTLIINNGGSGDAMIRFDYESNTDRARIGVSSSGQQLEFYTAGASERMRIDSSGNVGIGTASPGHKLQVNASAFDGIQLQSGGTDCGYFGVNTGTVYIGAGSTLAFHTGNSSLTNGTERMRIDSSGNLDLVADFYVGPSNNIIYESGTTFNVRAAVANLTFQTNGANERMRIDSSGRVLVGKTSSGITTAGSEVSSGSLQLSASSTSTNLSTSNGGVLNLCNPSATDGNFSNIGGYNSNGLVTSQIDFINVSHSSRTGAIAFLTHDGSSMPERVRIDSSGKVGIGTSSPANSIDISQGATSRVRATDGTRSLYSGVWSSQPRIESFGGSLQIEAGGAYDITFDTNSTEVMRIDSAGRVGIGTTSLVEKFQIAAPSGNGAGVEFAGNGNTVGSGSFFVGQGSGSEAYVYQRANTHMIFATNNTERARINASGGVYLGTTGTSIGSGNLVVNEGVYVGAANGDNQIRSSSAGGGSATLYIGNAAIQVSSDRRLKENIVDTSMSALDKLDQVRVVDFTWNDPSDTAVNNRNARGTWTGIIAQELVDVFPFAVNAPRNEDDLSIDEESKSTWHVDQDQLVPVLIKAIQELKAEVAALKGA